MYTVHGNEEKRLPGSKKKKVSPRSGTLYLELEAAARKVRIQGESVTVMTGTLLA
jgi:diaminopimelate epimerase